MGRIKQKFIKRTAKVLYGEMPEKFSPDFNQNKTVVRELEITASKKLRNKISGSLVTRAKTKKLE